MAKQMTLPPDAQARLSMLLNMGARPESRETASRPAESKQK